MPPPFPKFHPLYVPNPLSLPSPLLASLLIPPPLPFFPSGPPSFSSFYLCIKLGAGGADGRGGGKNSGGAEGRGVDGGAVGGAADISMRAVLGQEPELEWSLCYP